MAHSGLSRRAFAALAFAAPLGAASLATAQAPAALDTEDAATTAVTGQNRYRHITAEVFVNDQGPFTFLVDTGANRSAISEGLAARLGLPLDAHVEVNTVIGARPRPTVKVDSLRIGDQIQHRVEIPTLAMSAGTADGILGVDWLKNRRLTFFFADRRLVIERSAARSPLDGAQEERRSIHMPAQLRSGQLSLIDATIADQRVSAMIDTGAQFTLGNRALQSWAQRRMGASGLGEKIKIHTVTGETTEGDLLVLPNLRLGAAQFAAVPVVFSDVQVFKLWGMERQPALVLGLDLIAEFDAMSLDFGKRTVRLDLPRGVGTIREADRRPAPRTRKTAVL